MYIFEIGFCFGYLVFGVWVNEKVEISVKGFYVVGDMVVVLYNYMFGVFIYGWFVGCNVVEYVVGCVFSVVDSV